MVVIFLAFLGAVIASFLGVVAERIYTSESIVRGRSRCNSCSRELAPVDLIPVISWIFSRGRCRTCKAKVPARYALSEALLALLFVLAYVKLGLTIPLVIFLCVLSVLAFIVLYDLRHMVVPAGASTLLACLSTLYALSVWGADALAGAVFGVAGVIGLAFLFAFLVSRGRAMGLGDSPVALSLSLLAGPQAIAGLLFSFWSGALIGVLILVSRPKGHRMGIEVPFVPFLALGYLLAIFTQWNPLAFTL